VAVEMFCDFCESIIMTSRISQVVANVFVFAAILSRRVLPLMHFKVLISVVRIL